MEGHYCPACGTFIPKDASFCPECGRRVDDTPHPDADNRSELAAAVKRIQQGDKASFEKLVQLTSSMVSSNIRRYLSNESDIEDVQQEVYVKVFQNVQSLSDPDKAYGWIKTIASNTAINFTQTKFAKHEQPIQSRDDDQMANDPLDLEDTDKILSSPVEIPEDYMDNQETRRLVGEIVDSLPERMRAETADFYYNDRTIKEIAATAGRSEAAVKMDLCRARNILKKGFEELETKQGIKLYAIPAGMFFALVAGGAFAPGLDAKAAGAGASQAASGTAHSAGKTGSEAATGAASDASGARQTAGRAAGKAAGRAAGRTAGKTAGSAIVGGGAKAVGGFAALSTGMKAAVFAGVFAVAVGGTVGTAAVTGHLPSQQEQQEDQKPSGKTKSDSSKSDSADGSTSDSASQKAQEVDPAVWRKAYLDEINQQLDANTYAGDRNSTRISFLYLNDDDIPEVIVDYSENNISDQLMTYDENGVNVEEFEGNRRVDYIPGENRLRIWNGQQMWYQDTVYSVDDQKWDLLFDGTFEAADPYTYEMDELQFDSQGRIANPQEYKFSIGGTEVGFDKYYENLFRVYAPKKAVDLTDDQSRWCTADECVSYLETGQPSASGNGMPRK